MRNRFDRQLEELNDELIEMGTMIEKAIETAAKALISQDSELAKTVIEGDEQVDRQERIIENLCLKLLLQGFKAYIISLKDDNRHGKNRGSGGRYIRAYNYVIRGKVYKEA